LKTLRYSHTTCCTAKLKGTTNTKPKHEITKRKNEYEHVRQVKPEPSIYKTEEQPIQHVIMKTPSENKTHERYDGMMEHAFEYIVKYYANQAI
jgi:hypothetical protein